MMVIVMCTSSIAGDWNKVQCVEAAAYTLWPVISSVTANGLNDDVEIAPKKCYMMKRLCCGLLTLVNISQNVIVRCTLVLQNSPSELFHMSLRTSKSRLPHFSAAKQTCITGDCSSSPNTACTSKGQLPHSSLEGFSCTLKQPF